MANLAKIVVPWTGVSVIGPGVSTFYVDEAGSGWTSALSAFFSSVANKFPSGINWNVPTTGDLIDVATGGISGTWTDPGGGGVNSSGANAFVQGAGMRITWKTGGTHNGRRVVGATFMAPLDNGAWSLGGLPNSATVTALQNAANAFLSVSTFQPSIYSRPVDGAGGEAHPVTSAFVPAAVSWLRSRRT